MHLLLRKNRGRADSFHFHPELGLQPEVCHLNEGHAAYAVLERARHFMIDSGQEFEVALAATRAGNLFTTRRWRQALTASLRH